MRRRGSGENAHHHVESEKDLRQTNPYVQDLLVFSEAPDGGEDLVKIHLGRRGECRSQIGEAVVDGAAVGRRIKQRLLVNTHPTINQLYGAGMRGVGMSRESGEPVPITSNLDIILIPSSRSAQIGFH